MSKIVAYIRVSTASQHKSGLGEDAQRAAIAAFAVASGFEIAAEFVEAETGKGSNALDRRPELRAALEKAKALARLDKTRIYVVVSKLDRLSRDVHFISGLMLRKTFRSSSPSWARTSIRSCCTSMRRSPRKSAP